MLAGLNDDIEHKREDARYLRAVLSYVLDVMLRHDPALAYGPKGEALIGHLRKLTRREVLPKDTKR
jgi:hypothetical protein